METFHFCLKFNFFTSQTGQAGDAGQKPSAFWDSDCSPTLQHCELGDRAGDGDMGGHGSSHFTPETDTPSSHEDIRSTQLSTCRIIT